MRGAALIFAILYASVALAYNHQWKDAKVVSSEAGGVVAAKTQQEGTTNDSKGYLSRLFSPENLPNIGLFLAGVVGIVVALGTLNHMRQSSERQLRAYVVQERGAIVNIADPIPAVGLVPTEARITHPGWGPVAHLQIKNTGQTPALQVENWGNICFREYPLISTLPSKPAELRPMYSILGPGIISTKTLSFGPRLTPQQIADLQAGTAAIYVYGEIRYRDVFNKDHLTKYRGMHHVMGGPIGVSTNLTFTEGGNEAD
jgi:hypothetical protein